MAIDLPQRVACRYLHRIAAKPVHVKITGWGGKRKIPVKEMRAFIRDLEKVRGSSGLRGIDGFSTFSQTVQLPKGSLPQLAEVVKRHGLKMDPPKKATSGIIGIDAV